MPPNYKDAGEECIKPKAYSKGISYRYLHNCNKAHEEVGGCEPWHGYFLPKCKTNFYTVGNLCIPGCLEDMTETKLSCTKYYYSRGAG